MPTPLAALTFFHTFDCLLLLCCSALDTCLLQDSWEFSGLVSKDGNWRYWEWGFTACFGLIVSEFPGVQDEERCCMVYSALLYLRANGHAYRAPLGLEIMNN